MRRDTPRMPVSAKQRMMHKKFAIARKRSFIRRLPAAMITRARTATATKSVDANLSGSVVSTTAATVSVLPVPKLGSAFFNRLGNRTRGLSLTFTGNISLTGTNAAALSEEFMRFIVFYDRRPNGAVPTPQDLIADTDSSGTQTTNIRSAVNMNNRDRFIILRDRKVLLPPVGVNGAPSALAATLITDMSNDTHSGFKFMEFIPLKGLETIYNSNGAGTIADISAGALNILVANSDASGSPAWQFTANVRYRFLD